MNLHIRPLAFIACLLLPAVSLAMEPLPRADLALSNAAIGTPLLGLLDDYANLLPAKTSLSSIGEDGASHSWSAHRDTLLRVCQADPSACAPVLRAQFDTLGRELQKRDPKRLLTLRDVVVASAMTDLCQLAFLDMGDRCSPQNLRGMASWASIVWRSLGYDHLFLAYQDIDLSSREFTRNWVEHTAKLSPAETERELKNLERDKGASEREAYTLELRDSLSGAFSQWLMILMQHSTQSNHDGMLVDMANLARLAAQQGQIERAEQWWQLSQTLLTEHPELKNSNQCLLQSQRFGIDVELARSTQLIFDGPQRLQSLIDQDCPFTAQALQYGLLAIKQQQSAQALDALQRAEAACDHIDCRAYSRRQQIKALIAIAQGQLEAMRREAQHWQNRLNQGVLLSSECQIVWALADRLRDAGASVDAAALYLALDEQIELSRSQAAGSNPADLARYDELKRMRVRSDVAQGKQILPMKTESLRGQNLLRRLRSLRWLKDLANEHDVEAKAELDRQLVVISTLRQNLKQLLPDASAFTRAVVQAMLMDSEEAENLQRSIYLGKLAAKRQNLPENYGATALMLYEFSENASDDSPFSTFNALDNNEAYLSWLRVPGGYVGTLLAVVPRDRGPMSLPMKPRIIRQIFIPFTPQDEAMLQLYRDLLQSGASISRGVKLTLPLETDKAGLMLNGLPIWQQADGSFITSRTAPSGGRRIQNFGNLSDALFDRLLAPFAEYYQDAQRLIISPDGTLAYLPFETLTRHGVPVLETVDIGYVQSLAVYAELKKRSAAKKRKPDPSLLSVADPQYAASQPSTDAQESSSLRRLEGLNWPSLPGTRKESAAIVSLYRNNRQLLGAQASKNTLTGMQNKNVLKDFQILHFATHGYVDDERSALVLSPNQSPVSAYLMDQDIAGWSLDSDLVLLSACNTGIGHQQKGEGIVGLPYAFFMAGNINTLMSLWPVDDAGTATLMPAFMQRIQNGEDHVTALNNTKRAFARGDYGQALSNPRVWSAFVMYGIPLDK